MTLGRLPPEIYGAIIDASVLGESQVMLRLCLVCRYFRRVAEPLLYRAIFIPGRERLASLHRALCSRPTLSTHVRSLCVVDVPRRPPSGIDVVPAIAFTSPVAREARAARQAHVQSWLSARAQEQTRFGTQARTVVSMCAPYLISLTLLYYEHELPERERLLGHAGTARSQFAELLSLRYPRLRELTLRGCYPAPLFTPASAAMSGNLAALERLHLAAGEVPNPYVSFQAIADACPRLTHFRITEPPMVNALVRTLEAILQNLSRRATPNTRGRGGPSSGGQIVGGSIARLPPRLACLVVQPSAPSQMALVDAGDAPASEQIPTLHGLRHLLSQWERFGAQVTGFQFIVIPPPDSGDVRYFHHEARSHWLNRVNGGRGCWAS